jgi:3-hydroxypropanoate dehydrogenase
MLTFAFAFPPEKTLLDAKSLDVIFRSARTHNAFSGPVSDARLRELYDLMKWGPTTMNTQPARIVFVRSAAAKEKLKPAISTRPWPRR